MTAKPTVQRLTGIIHNECGSLPAIVDVLDYGGENHVGRLWVEGEPMAVALNGYSFAPRKLAGRPAKTARDVAVWLAFEWFRRDGSPKAAERVVDLWAPFKGITEASHVHAARKRASATLGNATGAAVLVNAGVPGGNLGGAAWLASGAAWTGPAASVAPTVTTDAWVWDHGDQEARFGILTARRT